MYTIQKTEVRCDGEFRGYTYPVYNKDGKFLEVFATEEEAREFVTTKIGKGFLIRAMQVAGFGHDEIMAMREAMENRNFSNIEFCEDCITKQWAQEETSTRRG